MTCFFFEFASLPQFLFSFFFLPCGKIVLKKEGTSVQPRSHPCTVCIGAEVSANHRGRLQSSDLGTNSSVYPDSGRSWVHTPNWLRWVDIFPRWSPPPQRKVVFWSIGFSLGFRRIFVYLSLLVLHVWGAMGIGGWASGWIPLSFVPCLLCFHSQPAPAAPFSSWLSPWERGGAGEGANFSPAGASTPKAVGLKCKPAEQPGEENEGGEILGRR